MTAAHEAVRGRVAGAAAVQALAGARVFLFAAPQDTARPYVVIPRVRFEMTGRLAGNSGPRAGEWRIESWADEADEAIALAAAVRGALDGFQGTVATGGSPAVNVALSCRLMFEDQAYDAASTLYAAAQAYHVFDTEGV